MLIKWRKNEFQSQAQLWQLRNRIDSVKEIRYDTTCSQNFVSIEQMVWKLLGRTNILRRQAHRRTHARAHTRSTHIHTPHHTNTIHTTHIHTPHPHADTHTPEIHFTSVVFLWKCRNKTKNGTSVEINDFILNSIEGENMDYRSVDSVLEVDNTVPVRVPEHARSSRFSSI